MICEKFLYSTAGSTHKAIVRFVKPQRLGHVKRREYTLYQRGLGKPKFIHWKRQKPGLR